jgi:hypothetical protein
MSNVKKSYFTKNKVDIYTKLTDQNIEYDLNVGVDYLVNQETISKNLKERLDYQKENSENYDSKPKIMFTETNLTKTNKILNSVSPSFINPYGLLHACIKIGPFVNY